MTKVIAFLEGYKEAADDKERPGRHLASELGGMITAPLATIGVGTRIGAAVDDLKASRPIQTGSSKNWISQVRNIEKSTAGARAGFGIASGLTTVAGIAALVAALVKKTRTDKEQKQYDTTGSKTLNLLLPGRGAYNLYKRMGHALDS